jgi:hypothetical protein
MRIATYKSGEQVEVLMINGGWSTIKLHGGQKKVRNSEISSVKDVSRATKAPPKAAREKKPIDINTRKNGKVDSIYLLHYGASKVQLEDGSVKRALDCGDEVASKMRGMTLDQAYAFAAKTLQTDEKTLRARYENLNLGMQRMNLGNLVRKALRGA